jgi:hypothetical protein
MQNNHHEEIDHVRTRRGNTVLIDDELVLVSGTRLKIASVHDEIWRPGQIVADPESFIARVKESPLAADIFTFVQKIPDCRPRYQYHYAWDNMAAIPITTYQDWWESVSSDMRKDVKRAEKRGLVVKEVEFNDELIRGIIEINNEIPVRQGKPFSHYGKDFDTVKKEHSTYLDRSVFIGAYYFDEFVGYIKMLHVADLECFMEILSKTKHYDKRPTNAMIAKAVQICEREGKSYLTYGRYHYGKKVRSTFVDFKHRTGFERVLFPRYYVPLTIKGYIATKLNLQLGLIGILPGAVISTLVDLRARFYQKKLGVSGSSDSGDS